MSTPGLPVSNVPMQTDAVVVQQVTVESCKAPKNNRQSMPEGPEIWRTADTLNFALKDKPVTGLHFAFEELRSFEKELSGKKIKNVEARGKAILIFFEGGLVLYSHNQLYGKWMVSENGDQPETTRKLRVAIHTDDQSAFLYSASQIEMLNGSEVPGHSYIKKLGPDVLHPDISVSDILSRFVDESFQNRKLTTLLLDQAFVSGIGNYLRSEIMFYAGVDPNHKLRNYTRQEKVALAEAAFTLSERSYKTGGIVNDPSIVKALKRENARKADWRFFVYKRTGGGCHKCGMTIREEKTGGRKIYYCPGCQLEK